MRAARGSLKIQNAKNRQKIVIWTPSHTFVGLYLRNGPRIDNRKNIFKQQYLLHMF